MYTDIVVRSSSIFCLTAARFSEGQTAGELSPLLQLKLLPGMSPLADHCDTTCDGEKQPNSNS